MTGRTGDKIKFTWKDHKLFFSYMHCIANEDDQIIGDLIGFGQEKTAAGY